MTWLKIDDKFPEHDRIVGLPGPGAKWLHVTALCQCAAHLTDGHIDPFRLKVIVAIAEVPKAAFQVTQLVESGLWESLGDGAYQIRDYLDYNPTASEVKKKRDAATKRMKALRSLDVRANKQRTDSERSGEQHANVRSPQTQSPAQSPKNKIKSSGLLDNGRSVACQDLLRLVQGGDNGTPRVVERLCKQLPKERIDRVASTLRVGVKPAIAVAALKREVLAYEAEVQAEGAA